MTNRTTPTTRTSRPVGADVKLASTHRELKGATTDGPVAALQRIAAQGLEGVLFRTLLEASPTLDPAELTDMRQCADDLGLYLEVGVGKVNPFMTGELPEIRALGDGSYLAGMERMIAAAASIGCHELWSATGNHHAEFPGLHAIDRYRPDAPWSEQLRLTESFLHQLAPALRDHGSHIDLETHEEITSSEVVDLAEAVGADVVGVTLDTANLCINGEDVIAATRRVAPYVRLTHLRDFVLFPVADGLERFLVPCGDGLVDWSEVLGLLAGSPLAHLSIEPAGDGQRGMTAHLDDPRWQAAHPDADTAEIALLRADADRCAASAQAGGGLTPHDWADGSPWKRAEFLDRCADHLRHVTSETDAPTTHDSQERP